MTTTARRSATIAGAAALALALSACGTAPGERGLTGAGVGAAAGAATGAVLGGSVVTGAVLGGAAGAAIGVLTDSEQLDLNRAVRPRNR